jgi:hypothetical protein
VVIVEAIKTGIFKQNDIKVRIYKVTTALPTLQVKLRRYSLLYRSSYGGTTYYIGQVTAVLPPLQVKLRRYFLLYRSLYGGTPYSTGQV